MESEMLRAAAHGLPVVVVNPTAVFGPGDVHLSLGGILLVIARGWMVAWVSAEVNAVDVRDVAQAQIQAAEVGGLGRRYILGGHNTTVRELASIAAEIAGQRKPRFELPLILVDMMVGLGTLIPPLDRMGNHLRAVRQWRGYDTSKAQQELGLHPRPLEETLRDALDWYRLHGYLG
jgi:dihydroflavonol-4-reductase